jgi:hypothetical protein
VFINTDTNNPEELADQFRHLDLHHPSLRELIVYGEIEPSVLLQSLETSTPSKESQITSLIIEGIVISETNPRAFQRLLEQLPHLHHLSVNFINSLSEADCESLFATLIVNEGTASRVRTLRLGTDSLTMITRLAQFVGANLIGLSNLGLEMHYGKDQLDILEPAFRKNHNLNSLSVHGSLASEADGERLARMISRLPLRRLELGKMFIALYQNGTTLWSSGFRRKLLLELKEKTDPLQVLVIMMPTATDIRDVNEFLDSQAGSQLQQLSVGNIKHHLDYTNYASLLEHTLSHPTLKEVEFRYISLRVILTMLQQIERVGRPPLRITLSNNGFPTSEGNKAIQELREKNIFVYAFM